MSESPGYSAPALEKGLDVLELLADAAEPLSQTEIATAQQRSVGQLFRVLTTLERRGWIVRTGEGGYLLSDRMFELAHRQEPRRGLLAAAMGPMRRLADELGHSCNLAVREGDVLRVIAQAESPSAFGFGVRVGAPFPLDTLTGYVLRAFGGDEDDEPELERIRRAGIGERRDSLHEGVTDIAHPIFGPDGRGIAAVTVPYVATSYSAVGLPEVRAAVARTAGEISTALGGGPR